LRRRQHPNDHQWHPCLPGSHLLGRLEVDCQEFLNLVSRYEWQVSHFLDGRRNAGIKVNIVA